MNDVVERLAECRIVPVLSAPDADAAEAACRGLVARGIGVVEIAFRTEAAVEAIARAAAIDGLLVGAGTVLSPAQARLAVEAGARFGVAPGTSPAVVEAARAAGLPFFPGVATPSEIEAARALGCRVLKLFPASLVGGPAFLKAVAPVYPDVRFLPTGGIDERSLDSYLELPNVLACGGTWVFREVTTA